MKPALAYVTAAVAAAVLSGCGSPPPPPAAPTTEATTTIRVHGTIERPGHYQVPRTGGVPCTSAVGDFIRENLWWWIGAGTKPLAGGRLGSGRVRDDVNPSGRSLNGPCSFPFDATVQMPAGGDVVLNFLDLTVPVNRLDLLAGPITIRTSVSGRLYVGVPGTEGIPTSAGG